jgi:uncharacterized protein
VIEYRTAGGSATASEGVLNGLVTPFNTWTTIGDIKRGGFKERIAPGAFTKTLQERDVVLINSHDPSQPMARTSIREGVGSLTLREDPSAGLRARAVPVDTSYARDVMACAEAGVTRGMSFGFEAIKDSWTDDEGRASNPQVGTRRTVHEVRLHECTTTAFPAYETTELSARDAINAARGIERRGAVCVDCEKPVAAGDKECPNCGRELDEADSDGRRSANPKPYGDVEYADPKNGKYPINSKERAVAAWDYINVKKNADEYPLNGVTLEEVKNKIKAALEHFGVEISEDERSLIVPIGETRSAEDVSINKNNKCSMCGQDIPGSTPDHPGPDGDGDSDHDDQKISRTSEPGETTPELDAVTLRAYLATAYGV